jgi:hypothetical protein
MTRILPVLHFHTVFTLPSELRALALCNRELIFDLLFAAASNTLQELGRDTKHLGGTLGITAVLHTWTRDLSFHPHLHCVVTGGGFDKINDAWIQSSPKFLFPVKVLSSLFRGKFLAALKKEQKKGHLEFAGSCAHLTTDSAFGGFLDTLYQKDWVVFAKQPFTKSKHIFEYLGRYTHRVAISNQRLIKMDNDGISFSTKNGKTATLSPLEFIRRFMLHVLPKSFFKIRHYGLYSSSNVNTLLKRAHNILQPPPPQISPDGPVVDHFSDVLHYIVMPSADWAELLTVLTGSDPTRCQICGQGRMIRTRIPPLACSQRCNSS